MTVTVYGASDDLIEIEGEIREEFAYHSGDEEMYLAFSSGTVLRIAYTADGVWEIRAMAGADKVTVAPNEGEDSDNYSDRATIEDDIRWVVLGVSFCRAPEMATTTVVTP